MADFFAMQQKLTNYFEEDCAEKRKDALKNKKKKLVQLELEFGQYQALVMAGLLTEYDMMNCIKYGPSWAEKECKPGDKTKLKDLFGEFTISDKPDDIHCAEKREVKFYLTFKSGKYTGPKFYVVSKLPDDAPCKIKSHVSTYNSLSCDI